MPGEAPPRVAEAAEGGLSVWYGGRSLYSRVDPRRAPERAAREVEARPETLYMVPSPLLGYGLETLLERIPETSAVLALEADPLLAELTETRLPDRLRGHPRFRFLPDPSRAAGAVRALGRFRRAVEVRLSSGRALRPEAYDLALRAVDAELDRYWRNRMTMVRMGRLWIRNVLRNLAALPEDALCEPASWDGATAVCGAGPSLDAACAWLAGERRRLRILACDTAVGPLVSRGIVPDGIVCLEAQIHNLKDFLPLGRREVPLFADLTSHPSAFRAVRGPKLLTLTRFDELGFLDRLEALPLPALRVPPLGSVGVLAVHLARRMSEGPVFLAGLDFSFPPGSTHAKGAPALRAEAFREDRLYKAPGQWRSTWPAGGGKEANPVLASYAALLAEEIRGDPRVFDIRTAGVPLGIPRVSRDQASRILDARGLRPLDPLPLGPGVPRDGLRAAAASFLDGEAERVELLLESLGDGAGLAARAAECGWLYSWFPDEHRVASLGPDIRNRLLAEALDWKRRLREARTALEA